MRQQMRAGREHGEQDFRSMACDARQGQLIEGPAGCRTGGAVVLAPFAVPIEVVAGPARGAARAAQVLGGQFRRAEHALAAGAGVQQRL